MSFKDFSTNHKPAGKPANDSKPAATAKPAPATADDKAPDTPPARS